VLFDKNLMKLQGMHAIMGALVLLALLQAGCIIGQAMGLSRAVCVLWEGTGAVASFPGGSGVGAVANMLVAGASPLEVALPDIVLFAASFVLLQLVRFAQETMLDRYSRERAQDLRRTLLARTFNGESLLSWHVGAARVVQTANDGIDEVQTYLRIIPPKIIGMAAVSVPLLVFAFVSDWVSGIILTVMFPVIIFYMILIGRRARAQSERQYAVYTRLTNRFMDTLRGLPVLKAFGATRREERRVYASSESLRAATMRTLRTAMLSGAVLDLCATFGVAAVAIMLAFRLMDGSIALYTGLLALIVSPEYFTPIRSFASDYHASLDGKNALMAVLKMTERDDTEERVSHPGGEGGTSAASESALRFAEQCAAGDRGSRFTLELEDVSHHYESGAGIEGVSFTVRSGEKIGVVGKSGAGKSTLAGLVAGFLKPDGGDVRVSGAPASLTGDEWRRHVRYIPQNPYVFRMTLAENIAFYRPDASRAEVEAAAVAVGLGDLVAELPDGLDTLVGEGARGLSGGQAHRVALARIILDDCARMLVFDEPTAHLDVETERDLKPAMLAAMEGKTVLFATHRLHWMADMDRTITLEDGRMVGDEPPHAGLGDSFADQTASGQNASGEKRSGARCPRTSSLGEASQETASSFHTFRTFPTWFKGYLSRYRRDVVVAIALGFAAMACAALLMFASGYLISATAIAGITLFSIMVPVACVQLFGFGRPAARYLERLASHNWVLRVTSDLRLSLYRAVEERTGDPLRERAMGEYLGVLSDDVAHLQNLYLRVVFPSAVAYLVALGAAVLFGFFSPLFALFIASSFAVVAVLLPLGCLRVTRRDAQRAKALKADGYAHLADDVFGAVDWVLAGREREVLAQHGEGDAAIRTLEARARMKQRAFTLAVTVALAGVLCAVIAWAAELFGGLATVGAAGAANAAGAAGAAGASEVAAATAAVAAAAAGAKVNWIAAFALGFFPLVEAFASLPAAFSEVIAHRDSIAHLDEYLHDKADAGDMAEPSDTGLRGLFKLLVASAGEMGAAPDEESTSSAPDLKASPATSEEARASVPGETLVQASDEAVGAHDLETARQGSEGFVAPASSISAIALQSITYTYPGSSRPAIDKLTLSVPAGESVAVLGQSGAGKTTLANVLCGVLSPERGRVMLGGTVPACDADFTRSVGFVGQVPYLFNRTLRENLTLGVLEEDDARLADAMRSVGLGGKLDSLEDGLDTVVGETGVGFSGGEAHRIAIARVLIADTPIVVVDEPFSALDPETERDLLDTLLRACEGRTLIVITHHLAQVDRFDRVIFIEGGTVDLDGSPAELLTSSARFRNLVEFDAVVCHSPVS